MDVTAPARPCRWWRLTRHSWSIVKTRPVDISYAVRYMPSAMPITTFALERCDRCGHRRLHEFHGQWLDQYPRWED